MAVQLSDYSTLYNDANLIYYWKFEGNSNSDKGSNNGTDTSVTYGSSYGKFGQGVSFDGSTSKIVLGTINNSATDATFSCWMKYTSATAGKYPFYFQNGSGAQIAEFQAEGTGKMYFVCRGANNNAGTSNALTPTAWNDGNWHLFTGVWDGTAGTSTIYVDGTSQNTGAAGSTGSVLSLHTTDSIGCALANPSSYGWAGSMDDFAVWSRKLTATEISNYYNATGGGAPSVNSNFFALM